MINMQSGWLYYACHHEDPLGPLPARCTYMFQQQLRAAVSCIKRHLCWPNCHAETHQYVLLLYVYLGHALIIGSRHLLQDANWHQLTSRLAVMCDAACSERID